MAWVVDPKAKYSRTVVDPETGEEAEVVLRKLTERDLQERDGKSISFNDSGKVSRRNNRRKKGRGSSGDVSFTPGQVRMFEIQRSIISWSIPIPLNAMSINTLDPEVSQQIHDHIVDLNPFFFDRDEDDEDDFPDDVDPDDEDGEDEDGSTYEGSASEHYEANGNGHEPGRGYDTDEEDPQVQYGHFNGPKDAAAKN